jgi:hypothetical protein
MRCSGARATLANPGWGLSKRRSIEVRSAIIGAVDVRRRDEEQGLFGVVIGDGRPLLLAVAGGLLFAGGFAIFLAATGDFLPQDVHFLGMTADELCAFASCRITEFMVHDRASFGGTLFGLGVLYVWLTAFPLSRGAQWAWWVWLISGTLGFLTFLAYLGYGYLDTWHGLATLLMLPAFVVGLVRSRALVEERLDPRALLRNGGWLHRRDRFTAGRLVLIAGAGAVAMSGLIILRIGIGDTFVPEDLAFMGKTADELRGINDRLVPLLAHDRAGFGGGVMTMGITTLLCLWCAPLSRHLHQAVAVAGAASLGSALVVHYAVGYTDAFHLAPPFAGLLCLVAGLTLENPGLPSRTGATREPGLPPGSRSGG